MSSDLIDNSDLPVPDLLTSLKEKADLLGIKYHPSIGVEALKEKIAAKMADAPASASVAVAAANGALVNQAGSGADTSGELVFMETPNQKRARLQREASELVRIRLTCMNPAKKEWEGEIFTVGNAVVGTHKKYVPFQAEDGWHVPRIILEALQAKECQIFVTTKGPRGEKVRQGKLIKEFAIEILPALTEQEIQELAQRQAMARGQAA